MSPDGTPMDWAGWLAREQERMTQGLALSRAALERFETLAADAATAIARHAQSVETKQAVVELRPRKPVDIESCLEKLRQGGPRVLSGRERRALVTHPGRVPVTAADEVLQESPALLRHLLRAVLSNWYQYRGQPWGAEYFELLCQRAKGSGIPLLESPVGARNALSRGTPPGDARLGASLANSDLPRVHSHLKDGLQLRDSWLYTGQVLASWLDAQLANGATLDDALEAIRRGPRLRAMLLPGRAANTNAVAGVRIDTMTHARSVATFLRAAFASPPLVSRARLAELNDEVLHSEFGDPRHPPLGQGWQLVKQLAEQSFAQLLSSLSEQDLEVFFEHAMNERDRRRFWTRYLGSIERTGCVLDAKSQQGLKAKLQASPELNGAIARAYCFGRPSDTQAFFLVFARIVVVEFSVTGNAAYVYEREYFEQKLEPRIRKGRCDGVGELKMQFHCIHRLTHHSGWQQAAERWLSEQGIHARRPGRK